MASSFEEVENHLRRRSRARLAGLAFRLAFIVTCSAAASGCGRDAAEVSPSSSVRRLEVGANATLSAVDYMLAGPMMFRQVGMLQVGSSFTLAATFGSLPTGTGYQVNVRGTASDGLTVCTGQATFDVVSGTTPSAAIPLSCSKPPTGTTVVNAAVNVCPVIDTLDAYPSEVIVGHSVAIVASAHDTDMGPNAALRGRWTVTGGVLQNPTMTGGTFICTAAGPATVNWEVRDGDTSDGCPAVATINITCTAP